MGYDRYQPYLIFIFNRLGYKGHYWGKYQNKTTRTILKYIDQRQKMPCVFIVLYVIFKMIYRYINKY